MIQPIMYQLNKLRPNHIQLMEYMLAHPEATYEDMAKLFGLTVPWISVVYNSDAFQRKLKQRQAELESMTDITVLDKIVGAASIGVERLANYMAVTNDPDFLLDATDKLLRRAGYGTAAKAPVVQNNFQQNNTFVPATPELLAECRNMMLGPQPEVQDVTPIAETRALTSGG